MASQRKLKFDLPLFLAKAGIGRSVAAYPKRLVIFTQGDLADAVFYIQKGKVKITVVSEEGREAVVAVLGPGGFCARAAWRGNRGGCPPRRR